MPQGRMSRKAHNVDREATEAKHFEDERSYLTHDGEEFLFGADMRNRRQEVYDRDGGVCRGCKKRVSWSWGQAHHVKHRGRGGSDSLGNLVWSCADCHSKEHVQVMWGTGGL